MLSDIHYYESGSGTKLEATKQGNTWVLPVMDTLKTWNVTFLFTSNVAKEEIADIVEKKLCCYQLLLSNQSAAVSALAFSGDRVFVRASVTDMQSWPKTVQLKMFHSGIMASPSDVGRALSSRAPSSGGQSQAAITPAQKASVAPIQRPFLDYSSTPVTVQPAKASYFAKFLYPTFSHQRCTDCHSMGDATTVRAQHAASGVPDVNATYAHQATCGGTSCHSLVTDWRTPPFAKGVHWKGKSAKEICQIVVGHLPTAQGLHHHFHDDPRVIWAVSSGWIPPNGQGKGQGYIPTAPPHDKNAWFQLVDYWITGGFPCPE